MYGTYGRASRLPRLKESVASFMAGCASMARRASSAAAIWKGGSLEGWVEVGEFCFG